MNITLYKSSLCPRCHMASKHLSTYVKQNNSVTITEVDVVIHPLHAWKEGIRFIPAIKIDDRILCGVYLSRHQIESFILQAKTL